MSRNPEWSRELDGQQHAAILRSVLARMLPARPSLPVLVERQGRRSAVYQAHMDAVPLIIKLTERRNSYPVEAWVYQQLENTGVPAPKVRFYSARLPHLLLPCLVMTRIDGLPLFTCESKGESEERLYEEVGRLLGRIHAVALPALHFGLGAFISAQGCAPHASWTAFAKSYHAHPASGIYLLEHGTLRGFSPAQFEQLSSMIATHRFAAVLNHGDFGPDHILVRGGRITGIIDPGEAFAGPAEYDLAYLGCYIKRHQLDAVLRGYERPLDKSMVRAYMTLIALHKAARSHRTGKLQRAGHFIAIARSAWYQKEFTCHK